MKELLLIVLLAYTFAQGEAAVQCCPQGEKITKRGICDGGSPANINCTAGRWLLKEVFLVGNKVYSQDAPNFVFVEDPNLYCLGDALRNSSNLSLGYVPSAMVCFDSSTTTSFQVTGVLALISVVFLLLTLAVYMFLPQMRDLQGLCYISLCISMALGFLSLGILQLGPRLRDENCAMTGFIVYFWMLATFFWMHIIGINTFRTIGEASYLKKTTRQQYFKYSLYAWGGPLVFLMVALITNFVEGDHFKPGFGKNSCWFQGSTETWIFFYGPMAVLVACNVVLFIAASCVLWRQSRKYEVDKLNNLKYKFLMSLKLFLVMGISWVFELTSFADGSSSWVWKITDYFNCLQGVIIFILLVVLRKRAIKGLISEGCCLRYTVPLAEKLSPHDDEEAEQVLGDDTTEVRLN